MSARLALIVLCATAASAQAGPPTEAQCRGFLEEGLASKDPEKARDRFHVARVRCANPVTLVMIARTYQEHGDLARALAYLDAFLAAVGQHELRPIVEKTAAELRERVPEDQRVDISGELAAKAAAASADDTGALRLNRQVEGMDEKGYVERRPALAVRSTSPTASKLGRPRGFFFGANLAYAPVAKVDIANERMKGRVDFNAVFAGELQAGYRIVPALSVALVPQMLLNLSVPDQGAAREFELFAQATGHYALAARWDVNVSVAPGFGVLLVPGADDAKGFVVRWGGGPMYHANAHVSFAAELSSQTGFQRTGDIDMATSFVSLFVGIRYRP